MPISCRTSAASLKATRPSISRVCEPWYSVLCSAKATFGLTGPPKKISTLSVTPSASAPSAASTEAIGRRVIGRLMTMPSAPLRPCCAIMITARSNGSRKLGDAIRSWPANDVRPETSGSVGKAACRIAAGITIAIAATIQRLQCRLNKSATAGSLIEAMITPVPRTRSSHKFAACSDANFGFKSGTTKDRLASVIVDSEVRTSVPQMITNFGIGTLARGNNQVQAPSISNKLHGDAAETAEIGVQCVALAGMHHARERAGEHQMADLERDAMLAEFVGEPCHAQSRMAEHAGGDAGLLDLGIAVHNAADPAQVDVERTDRAAANHDSGSGAVVGHRIENPARVLQAGIDDLDRRHDIFRGAQHIGQADAGAAQRFAQHKGKLDFDPRHAIIFMSDARAIGDHHAVEEMSVVRLVDLRRALHRLGGKPDLVADELGARRDLAIGDFGGNGIGVFHGDAGPGLRQLHRLFAVLFGGNKNIGGFPAISVRHHGGENPYVTRTIKSVTSSP